MFTKLSPIPIIILAVAMTLAVGCRKGAPPHDYMGQPVPQVSAKITNDKVKDAIIRGASVRGWQVVPEQGNQLRATLYVRSHTAVVLIAYTTKTYSITYLDSTNLEYENGVIHPNYNNWVRNLQIAINAELARIQ